MTEALAPPAGDSFRHPILVTGAHRSGTTWVGKMLAAGSQAGYISEPFNVLHRPGVMITPVHHWYQYVCRENEAEFLPGLLQTLHFRYHFLTEIRSLRSTHDLGRMCRDGWLFQRARLLKQRPLLKDPFAFFSAPWLADRLDCQVVITVRHPAAFVSSLKRLDWPFDLRDLLAQPMLMRDMLEPYRADIERVSSDPGDSIGQNSLLWRIIYALATEFVKDSPDILIVRHEVLSRQPVEGYRRLYQALGLKFTSRVQRKIMASSSAENPKELTRSLVHSVRLDSQANLDNWKRRLSQPEIDRIRSLTEDIAALYYPDMDWV